MNDTDRDFQTIVLAALLHDIGKFWQRTGEQPDRKHPELSAWFVRERLGDRWPEVEDAVSNHHLPNAASSRNPRLALTVALADWLSSGERRDLPEGETGVPSEDTLISIFSQLRGASKPTSYPLIELPADGKLAPAAEVRANKADYALLWQAFASESKLVRREDFDLLTDQLLAMLEKYALFVPSAAWKSRSDISLYHHLKSTAAIAACLCRDGLDEKAVNDLLTTFDTGHGGGQPVAHLVGGDVSGIQSFIYNLTSKGALKGLRGRSLYLQLLPEAIAGRVLDEFGLTRANIIYCGGGHFYVLVPACADVEQRLNEVARHVDMTLLDAHGGRLSVSVASRELRVADFRRETFGVAWDGLHQQLAREKRRRFSRLFSASGAVETVLGPTGVGGEPSACSVCG